MDPARFLSTFIVLSAVTCTSALARQTPPLADERIRMAGEVLIAKTEWPSDPAAFGFKTLTIGAPFDLSHPLVQAHSDEHLIRPNSTHLIYCYLHQKAPIMRCRLRYWNDNDYGPEFNVLKTAFGDHVEVEFEVLLGAVPTAKQVAARQFGSGRISTVKLLNRFPSPGYVEAAVEHFSTVAGADPTTRKIFKDPQAVYTTECAASMAALSRKPISELTPSDLAAEAACDKQAMQRVVSGRTRAVWTTAYLWNPIRPLRRVGIVSEESLTTVGGASSPLSSEVTIVLALNHADAVAAFNQAVEAVERETVRVEREQSLKDF